MTGEIRIWKDELDRLSEYSWTLPTGFRDGKTWKRVTAGGVLVGTQFLVNGAPYISWLRPVLISGPRQPGSRSRFTGSR
jgi:hypothetical protein